MILAIDIGNSTIHFAFLNKGKAGRVWKVENDPESGLFLTKLENFLECATNRHAVDQVIVCSVVPASLKLIQVKVKKFLGLRPLVVGRDIKVPIVNKYRHPRQVGKDRLVCAFAARELYGSPAIVIDLGTAITFDSVSAKGEYLGGAIIPGIRLSAEALYEKTALLPHIQIAEPNKIIGRTTEESIRSGIFHGYGALCDGMIGRLGEEMGATPRVIMTGSYADIMLKFLRHRIDAVDEALIFKGMARLATTA